MAVADPGHLDSKARRLLGYVFDRSHFGLVLVSTLRLYETFTDGSRPASDLEQLCSRVGICELLPGLMEWEARQMIHKMLGRVPEMTIKQILKQTGNSVRRLAKLLEHLNTPREINGDRSVDELLEVAGPGLPRV